MLLRVVPFLVCLWLVAAAPPVPTWPSSYLIEGTLSLEPVGFDKITFDNVTIYYDEQYGGLVAYDNSEHYIVQSIAANASFEVMAAYNTYICIVTQGGGGPSLMKGTKHVHSRMLAAAPSSIAIQPGLPDTTDYVYMGQMVCPGKKKDVCLHFQKVEPETSGKVNNYELYMFEDGTPHRYEWLGYDELLGSHFDHYVFTYTKYVPGFSDASLVAQPSICNNTNSGSGSAASADAVEKSEKDMPSHWQEGRTAIHYLHKAIHSVAKAGFHKFKRTFGKKYESEDEHNKRLLHYTSNMHFVNTHNARKDASYTMKLNHMADVHQSEMRLRKGLLGKPDLSKAKFVHTADPNVKIPDAVDWRAQNLVSPVKDQGVCGSCWSFSTTGALEGQYAKAKGEMVILSQQMLVDCAWNGNMGCDGGEQNLAYEYIQQVGIPLAVDYGPYKMINEMCHYKNLSSSITVSGYNSIQEGNETALAQASSQVGPIAISIDASHMSFVFYDSGVYYEPTCTNNPDDLDHAVLLVGYGTLNGSDYWLVKNSWSTFWGDFGYVKMARNQNNNCGVASGALYPILA